MDTIDKPAKMKERISELPIMRNGYGSVSKAVMDNACLKPVAKAIYAYLAAHANQNRMAYPSHERIVSELHVGKESFYSNLRKLCDFGYVNIEREMGGTKYGRNQYHLLPLQDSDTDEKKGYGLIPRLVMIDPTVSAKAKAIYAYLAAHAGVKRQLEIKTAIAQKQIGMNNDTFTKARDELVSSGLIRYTEIRNKDGKFLGSLYLLANAPGQFQREPEKRKEEKRKEEKREEENREVENREANSIRSKNNSKNNNSDYHYPSIILQEGGKMDTTEIEDFVIDSILSKEGIDDDILVDDKFRVITARLLSSWYEKSSRKAWGQGELAGVGHKTYGLYVDALADLLDPAIEKRTICKTCVSHWRLIETINRRIIINGMDFYLPFEAAVDDFVQAVTTKDIKSKFSYMQSCIWQALLKGDIDDEAPAAC